MTRRSFMALLGGTVAWPRTAFASQVARPVIGFLNSGSPRPFAKLVAAFHEGLNELGYAEGRNVSIDYRWAEGQYDDLSTMAADLVRRDVTLIAASGGVRTAQAAKSATAKIPVVFVIGYDPVELGLVESLHRPGGNATGVCVLTTELATKRMELLHELVPGVHTVAILVNPGSASAEIETRNATTAAKYYGVRLLVLEAQSDNDFAEAFASAVRQHASALIVNADPFFNTRRDRLVALAARYGLPTMYPWREYVEAGGLVSYGTDLPWAYRQIGVYAGRIINGTKPEDLPVQLPTNFDLVINMKTAEALGLVVSPWVLTRVHDAIE